MSSCISIFRDRLMDRLMEKKTIIKEDKTVIFGSWSFPDGLQGCSGEVWPSGRLDNPPLLCRRTVTNYLLIQKNAQYFEEQFQI